MRTFTDQQTITEVKRQVYSGSAPNIKSVLTVVAGFTPTAYLRPLTESEASLNGMQWGQAYQLITEVGVDIRKGDKLVISSTDYLVHAMAVHNRGRNTAYQKYLLVKPEA